MMNKIHDLKTRQMVPNDNTLSCIYRLNEISEVFIASVSYCLCKAELKSYHVKEANISMALNMLLNSHQSCTYVHIAKDQLTTAEKVGDYLSIYV